MRAQPEQRIIESPYLRELLTCLAQNLAQGMLAFSPPGPGGA